MPAPEHDWQRMVVTPIRIHVIDGIPLAVPHEEGLAKIVEGCFLCDMTLEEGWDLPCPGMPIEELIGDGNASGS